MRAAETLSEKVRRRYEDLSEGQRRIARFCLARPDAAAQWTAGKIGRELKLSESTVVRFSVALGYEGFPDMQASIRIGAGSFHEGATRESDVRVARIAAASFKSDLDNLRDALKDVEHMRLADIAKVINEANRVHIVGFRTSFGLAYMASLHLTHVLDDVRLMDDSGGAFEDHLGLVAPRDCLVAVMFPVYDERTLNAIRSAHERGCSIIVITDSALAPLPLGNSIWPIFVKHESVSFFNSNVAGTAVLNALVSETIAYRAERDVDADLGKRIAVEFHVPRAREGEGLIAPAGEEN